jgi:hypothetical protein
VAHMLGTYHLIGMRPILAGRRKQHAPRAPEIIHSGDFEACYERMGRICGRSGLNEKQLVLNGLPIYANDDWTFYIVPSPAPEP